MPKGELNKDIDLKIKSPVIDIQNLTEAIELATELDAQKVFGESNKIELLELITNGVDPDNAEELGKLLDLDSMPKLLEALIKIRDNFIRETSEEIYELDHKPLEDENNQVQVKRKPLFSWWKNIGSKSASPNLDYKKLTIKKADGDSTSGIYPGEYDNNTVENLSDNSQYGRRIDYQTQDFLRWLEENMSRRYDRPFPGKKDVIPPEADQPSGVGAATASAKTKPFYKQAASVAKLGVTKTFEILYGIDDLKASIAMALDKKPSASPEEIFEMVILDIEKLIPDYRIYTGLTLHEIDKKEDLRINEEGIRENIQLYLNQPEAERTRRDERGKPLAVKEKQQQENPSEYQGRLSSLKTAFQPDPNVTDDAHYDVEKNLGESLVNKDERMYRKRKGQGDDLEAPNERKQP